MKKLAQYIKISVRLSVTLLIVHWRPTRLRPDPPFESFGSINCQIQTASRGAIAKSELSVLGGKTKKGEVERVRDYGINVAHTEMKTKMNETRNNQRDGRRRT